MLHMEVLHSLLYYLLLIVGIDNKSIKNVPTKTTL